MPRHDSPRTPYDETAAPRSVASAAARTATWLPGQRVLNDAELALGLGHVVAVVDQRSVKIHFGATDEMRIYNIRTAPIRRMRLRVGQQARLRDGRRFKVEKILRNSAGLLVYLGEGIKVPETELADAIPAAEAVDRLQAGQFGEVGDYALRIDGWRLRQSFLATDTRGLVGSRIRPLGHQLYIANKIAHQEVPRVLLADEVGLGKTIEAGLIFSGLRALGRAQRVLIVTPPSLVHQWMAEMYRKFNEMFSVLSEERCDEIDDSTGGGLSPFETSPRAIVGMDVLLRTKLRLRQAAEVSWDLLIVDEAHHLKWTNPTASSEDAKGARRDEQRAYDAVELLARRAQGLLLLTATPARDGLATEFGLLRLVDPDRFSDFGEFERDRDRMQQVAEVAAALAAMPAAAESVPQGARGAKAEDALQRLQRLYPHDDGLQAAVKAGDRGRLLRELIDRHGTGRVLVRNRRDRLHGFPERVLHGIPLEGPWHDEDGDLSQKAALPCDARPADARVTWLIQTVRALEPEKVVLICATERIVHMLAKVIREKTLLKAAVFHEGLSMVERDRQAAWFAEPDGAQLLLCSEIGGEGRNFQFSHHLVLFDLPIHPDLVEQRIGRLDRIGQDHAIHVHVPFLAATPSEALFRWHRDALLSFERPVSGAEEVMLEMQWQLGEVLKAWQPTSKQFARREKMLAELNRETAQTLAHVRQTVEKNVDFLVDLNSYDEDTGARLVEEIRTVDTDPTLPAWMSRVFDRYGVVEEQVDEQGRVRVRAGEMMFVEVFPGLPSDDMGATWKRTLALAREDLQFLSRDHTLVDGALGLVLDGDEGRAAVCAWPQPARPILQGALLQCLFVLDVSGPPALELHRYAPITPIEVVVDLQGKPRDELLEALTVAKLKKAGPDTIALVQPLFETRVPALLEEAQAEATRRAAPLVGAAVERARAALGEQHQRLIELRRVNPTLPQAEVERFTKRSARTLRALSEAEVHLDALRIVVAETDGQTPPGPRKA